MVKQIFKLTKVGNDFIVSDTKDMFINQKIVKEIGSNNYLVLKTLVCYADLKGKCYPSISTIQDILGLSFNTVNKALKELEQMGYITKELIKLKGVKQKHNEYTIVGYADNFFDEDSGSDEDRLLAHFKNKFNEFYGFDYEPAAKDLEQLNDIYRRCDYNFDKCCRLIDKAIAQYKPANSNAKYKTLGIYFLYSNKSFFKLCMDMVARDIKQGKYTIADDEKTNVISIADRFVTNGDDELIEKVEYEGIPF